MANDLVPALDDRFDRLGKLNGAETVRHEISLHAVAVQNIEDSQNPDFTAVQNLADPGRVRSGLGHVMRLKGYAAKEGDPRAIGPFDVLLRRFPVLPSPARFLHPVIVGPGRALSGGSWRCGQ